MPYTKCRHILPCPAIPINAATPLSLRAWIWLLRNRLAPPPVGNPTHTPLLQKFFGQKRCNLLHIFIYWLHMELHIFIY